jgi:hypothetical protein
MGDSSGLNLLRVSESRAGEKVTVTSTTTGVASAGDFDAYVDDDGCVRQRGNGAAFNSHQYRLKQ